MFFSPKGPFGPIDVYLDGVLQTRCFYADDEKGWAVVDYDPSVHSALSAFDFHGRQCVKVYGDVRVIFPADILICLAEKEKRKVVALDNEWLMRAHGVDSPEAAYLAELAREDDRSARTFGVVYKQKAK